MSNRVALGQGSRIAGTLLPHGCSILNPRSWILLLTLFPRQAVKSPSGPAPAVVLFVELSLESVQHVVDLGESRSLERMAGIERAVAAAANQHYGAVNARSFSHVSDEIGIDVPVRAIVPGDVDRARRMTDKQELHLAAAVDENRVGIGV